MRNGRAHTHLTNVTLTWLTARWRRYPYHIPSHTVWRINQVESSELKEKEDDVRNTLEDASCQSRSGIRRIIYVFIEAKQHDLHMWRDAAKFKIICDLGICVPSVVWSAFAVLFNDYTNASCNHKYPCHMGHPQILKVFQMGAWQLVKKGASIYTMPFFSPLRSNKHFGQKYGYRV